MTIEITKEAFNSIVENEQNCFKSNDKKELYEKTFFYSKGMNLFTIFNFVCFDFFDVDVVEDFAFFVLGAFRLLDISPL